MQDKYCELIIDKNGTIQSTDDIQTEIKTIPQQISHDKKYGKLSPRNGKYFTFAVYGEDTEIKNKTIIKGVQYAFKRWTIYTKSKVKKAKKNQTPDFKIYFRNPRTDKLLKKNTIMYHFYPINDLNNEHRGVCVINSNFYFTIHGKPISMYMIDQKNYPVDTRVKGITMDIDKIITHEFGHGWGLPHDDTIHTMMYYSEGGMAEFPHPRDIARMQAKEGVNTMSKHRLLRFLKWLVHRSDNY